MRFILALGLLAALSACSSIPTSEKFGPDVKIADPHEIIFIHGMFMTPKCWTNWESYFAKRGYRVSSPAWPLHEGSPETLRSTDHLAALSKLDLATVVDHYRKLLSSKKTKPVLIGHSMGGLIAQILLTEGLASAAVAIDSAPPKGVISLKWSFIRSNWGAINPFASDDKPLEMDLGSFSYAFVNAQPEPDQKKIYETYYVPESRRIGKGPTQVIANIDESKARGPLLLIAGAKDHIIPAKLNYSNFKKFEKTPAFTEFALFEGRDHWTIGAPSWEQLAQLTAQWLSAHSSN